MSIQIEHISKSFGKVEALRDISLDIKPGELFGLIGPDGAGKTTLMRILVTLLLADEGSATVHGWDVVKDYTAIRRSVGYMPGRFSLYQDLTVEENLRFFATIFGTTIKENYDLVADIYSQIEPFKNRRAGALSGGMKQKLALSCALIHKPKVLFLDEPTTGVDAVSRKEFWEMLQRLREQQITILVSTPYMDEASLCERVALIQKGKIMQVDTPEGVIDQFDKYLWAASASNSYALLSSLRKLPEVHSAYPSGERMHFTTLEKISPDRMSDKMDLEDVKIRAQQPTIEDCFMNLMEEGV